MKATCNIFDQYLHVYFVLALLFYAVGCTTTKQYTADNTTTPEQFVRMYGPPNYVQEQAGDMGRFFKWGAVNRYVWKVDVEYYYYLDKNIEVEFVDNQFISVKPISSDAFYFINQVSEQ